MSETGYGGGVGPVAQQGTVAPGQVAVFVREGVVAGAIKYVEEAPYDGKLYGRQNWEWELIPDVPANVGTVTAITAGTGLSGGTITGAGTIALQVPVSLTLGGTGTSVNDYRALLAVMGGAPLASPSFIGAPRSMSAPDLTDNSTQLATTAWVTAKIAASGGGGGGGPPATGGGGPTIGLGGGATVGLGGGATVGLGGGTSGSGARTEGATVGLGGGAELGLGAGATVGLGGTAAALREQIAELEARIAALEGTK